MKPALIALATFLISTSASAAPRSVTLAVPGMTCAACPITVKKALSQVAGVQKVELSYERREAVVNFDDAKVATPQLMRATADAGYPSTVKATAK
jgi:mercuric ion binding protein